MHVSVTTTSTDRSAHLLWHCASLTLAALGLLAIIGMLALLLSMVARGDPRGILQIEAQTLARTLALAAAEARYAGRALAWTADESGYRFWSLDPVAGWVELEGNDILRARTLPAGMYFSGPTFENFAQEGGQRVEFAAWGEIPDFAVGLALDEVRYAITASTIGEIRAEPVRHMGGNAVVLR